MLKASASLSAYRLARSEFSDSRASTLRFTGCARSHPQIANSATSKRTASESSALLAPPLEPTALARVLHSLPNQPTAIDSNRLGSADGATNSLAGASSLYGDSLVARRACMIRSPACTERTKPLPNPLRYHPPAAPASVAAEAIELVAPTLAAGITALSAAAFAPGRIST